MRCIGDTWKAMGKEVRHCYLYLWWVPNMISSFACKEKKKTLKVRNVTTVPKEVIILGIPEKVSRLDKAQLPFSIGANSLSALHEPPGEDTFYQQEKKNKCKLREKKTKTPRPGIEPGSST